MGSPLCRGPLYLWRVSYTTTESDLDTFPPQALGGTYHLPAGNSKASSVISSQETWPGKCFPFTAGLNLGADTPCASGRCAPQCAGVSMHPSVRQHDSRERNF